MQRLFGMENDENDLGDNFKNFEYESIYVMMNIDSLTFMLLACPLLILSVLFINKIFWNKPR
jgi:hypothetical protein